jgi:hypothetical protein
MKNGTSYCCMHLRGGAVVQRLFVKHLVKIVAQRRLMIAEKDDHGPLPAGGIVLNQLPDGVVALFISEKYCA